MIDRISHLMTLLAKEFDVPTYEIVQHGVYGVAHKKGMVDRLSQSDIHAKRAELEYLQDIVITRSHVRW